LQSGVQRREKKEVKRVRRRLRKNGESSSSADGSEKKEPKDSPYLVKIERKRELGSPPVRGKKGGSR